MCVRLQPSGVGGDRPATGGGERFAWCFRVRFCAVIVGGFPTLER